MPIKRPFNIGHKYTRKGIWDILQVPNERRKGNWYTGYNKYGKDWFIFCGLNTPGRTGHSYKNEFIGDELVWYANNRSHLQQPSIQSMIKPEGNIYIFTRESSQDPEFTYRGNARVKEFFDTRPVKIIWSFQDDNEFYPYTLPQEVNGSLNYKEGAVKQIKVNAYERNPIARQKCIEHYGTNCVVCGFNFYETYGEVGKDYIQVHHLVPLSEIKEEYSIDPIKDLRPVCPNCHAMLHRKKPPLTIEDLQQLIK